MSDSWKSKIDSLKSSLTQAATNTEGDVEVSAFVARLRETVGKTASEVDTDALAAQLKGALGQVEGKIDASKLKEYVAGLDREKLTAMLDEARTRAEPAAQNIAAQGGRLVENAPGKVDKVVGAAKEKLGNLTGDEDLAHAGELDQLRGEIKEKYAASDVAADAAQGGQAASNEAK
jgi:uncharacterized protein YjbJ (UPF0337 family)